jgi:hypothetical protein
VPISECHETSIKSPGSDATTASTTSLLYKLKEVYIRQHEQKSELSFMYESTSGRLLVLKYVLNENMNHIFSKDVISSVKGKTIFKKNI